MEKLGIETTKEVLGTLLDVGILAYKSYADDEKISTSEGIKLALKIPAVWRSIKDIKEAIPECKDIDPEELEELLGFVLGKLNTLKEVAQ